MEQRTFSDQVADFICQLHKMHQDNGQCTYYAKEQSEQLIPIMPVTPFVFEFFIYNSIYQVDWDDSLRTEGVKNHPRGLKEAEQQEKLEEFLKPYIRKEPALLYEVFLPIRNIRDTTLEDDWLEVSPDSRITAEEGKRFFRRLQRLQALLSNAGQPDNFRVNDSLFELIGECRYYIYLVRNNIFHGSKVIGETYEEKQKRRIQIYLTFLRCMMSLFFLVCDKHLLRATSNSSTEA